MLGSWFLSGVSGGVFILFFLILTQVNTILSKLLEEQILSRIF